MSTFQPGSHYAFPAPIPEADTAHIARKMFDIAYADRSPAQRLDIYWPADGAGPFPVIVAIHGGAFMGGDKRDAQLTPMLAGLERGYAVVSINYRMSGEATFPALVHDVKAAIRWMRANAANFLFDSTRIAVWGGSAGGYLALMAGVSAGVAALEDLALGNADQPSHVQAVVDWFGPTDFLKMDAQLAESGMAPPPAFAHSGPNSPESLLLGRQITEIPDLVHAANPETYLHEQAPPFFIQHGDIDVVVPYQQSAYFAARAQVILGLPKVYFELLLNAGHADPAFTTSENVQKVLAFLDQALRV
ncbi:MAG TPA: alpha/beta hydrolase [Chloroflexi bacterium]|nr:alpha/beta hydrolase [Chloroflexota bacterium]HHW88623.1 alpha/beta hydrolase [Chloroflexota bacterium]